jgi:MFS family permease
MMGAFRSLANYNFRVWSAGSLVSNIGTWMQRIAQDWLVLTQLTHHNATAVGVVMALQTVPTLVLLPFTGHAADHWDLRRLLIVTQVVLGLQALALGLLTVAGLVQLWHVYIFAAVFGCVSAFDMPARQAFAPEMVGDEDLPNAVSLNSTSFNLARLVGPAVAGLAIGAVGTGWAFLINAGSFAAVLGSLGLLRMKQMHVRPRRASAPGGFVEGLIYVWRRPDLRTVMLMIMLVGAFGLNFPIFIATMSVSVFHAGASQYGLLSSIMAIGTIAGALVTAGQRAPRLRRLALAAAVFGIGLALAAVAPGFWVFGLLLILVGLAAVSFTISNSSYVQLATEPAMRGRVIALRLAVAMGGMSVGAPLLGWTSDSFGPRWSVGLGAASALAAAAITLHYLVAHRGLRLRRDGRRLRLGLADDGPEVGLGS